MSTPSERFWAKVARQEGCWPWRGAARGGYGHVMFKGRSHNAHRIAYVLTYGEPAVGLVIDHLCRNRICCNPEHLEAVTNRENLLRSPLGAGGRARRTHCPYGHPYSPENTYVGPRNQRWCRQCRAEQMRRRRRAAVA